MEKLMKVFTWGKQVTGLDPFILLYNNYREYWYSPLNLGINFIQISVVVVIVLKLTVKDRGKVCYHHQPQNLEKQQPKSIL